VREIDQRVLLVGQSRSELRCRTASEHPLGAGPDGRRVRPRPLVVNLRTAGLAPTGLHILRHSAAKLRRDAGASIEAVSSFLDHSSLAVTSVYLRRLEGEADRTWPDVAVAIGV